MSKTLRSLAAFAIVALISVICASTLGIGAGVNAVTTLGEKA